MSTTKNTRKKKPTKQGNGSSLGSFQKFLKENKNLTPNFTRGETELTMEEVSKHNTVSDCWTIYKGNVYNIGPFLEYHPGGDDELFRAAGIDCTEFFDKYHRWVNCDAVMGPLKLGALKTKPKLTPEKPHPEALGATISVADSISSVGCVGSTQDREVTERRRRVLTIETSGECDESSVPNITLHPVLRQPIKLFRIFNSVRDV